LNTLKGTNWLNWLNWLKKLKKLKKLNWLNILTGFNRARRRVFCRLSLDSRRRGDPAEGSSAC
jgi:hypothetical protein